MAMDVSSSSDTGNRFWTFVSNGLNTISLSAKPVSIGNCSDKSDQWSPR